MPIQCVVPGSEDEVGAAGAQDGELPSVTSGASFPPLAHRGPRGLRLFSALVTPGAVLSLQPASGASGRLGCLRSGVKILATNPQGQEPSLGEGSQRAHSGWTGLAVPRDSRGP